MVESQTFVSRRRHTVGRRPRKLFTAKGLVKEGEGDEQKPCVPPVELGIAYTNSQESPEDVTKCTQASFLAKQAPRPIEISKEGKGTRTDEYDSSHSSRTEKSSSHRFENQLEHALQMSCMDGLLFSGAVDKSRNRILAFEEANHKYTRNGIPMPQLQDLSDRLSPTPFDMSHIFPGRDMAHSKPTGFTCQMPYQNFRDQISEDNTVRGNVMTYGPGDPRRQFDMRMQRELASSHYPPQVFHHPHLELDAPPSHIFIGEQPCFSEDLIPVDDLPPPASNINLTKYHPKPLIRRPDHAFDKPMFSNDSDDSDQGSDVSVENKIAAKKSSSPRLNVPTRQTKQIAGQTKMALASLRKGREDDPSFDREDDGMSIDKPPQAKADISAKPRSEVDDGTHFRKDTRVISSPVHKVTSASSSMVTDQSVGENSTDESAASDKAITSEEPKPKAKHVGPLYGGNKVSAPSKEVTSPHLDDENIELLVPQDENGGPAATPRPRLRPDHLEKIDQNKQDIMTSTHVLNSRQIPSSKLSSSTHAVLHGSPRHRKPFHLMVGTNVQTISQEGDDEFTNPKGSIQQSFTSMNESPRKVTRARGKPLSALGASRFGHDESFDEAEFFDSTMA